MSNPILEQFALDGRPVKHVMISIRFDDGTKIKMDVSGKFARRVIRALTAPEDDPLWGDGKGGEE